MGQTPSNERFLCNTQMDRMKSELEKILSELNKAKSINTFVKETTSSGDKIFEKIKILEDKNLNLNLNFYQFNYLNVRKYLSKHQKLFINGEMKNEFNRKIKEAENAFISEINSMDTNQLVENRNIELKKQFTQIYDMYLSAVDIVVSNKVKTEYIVSILMYTVYVNTFIPMIIECIRLSIDETLHWLKDNGQIKKVIMDIRFWEYDDSTCKCGCEGDGMRLKTGPRNVNVWERNPENTHR
jgi:hypothetical protein